MDSGLHEVLELLAKENYVKIVQAWLLNLSRHVDYLCGASFLGVLVFGMT